MKQIKNLKNITSIGSKGTLAMLLIISLGMMPKIATATSSHNSADSVSVAVLNFVLTQEYLKYEFYKQGTSPSVANIFTGQGQTAAAAADLAKIRDHQLQHINFLNKTITDLGGIPRNPLIYNTIVANSNFDYTGGGKFNTVFTDYDVFLSVAQAFEDLGVRACKGQIVSLLGKKIELTAVLNIQAVESSHAAHIRQMRRDRKVINNKGSALVTMKPWITGTTSSSASGSNDSGIGTNVDAIYTGSTKENNVKQNGSVISVNISQLVAIETGLVTPVSAATEAFDEPLTLAEVSAIITPYIKSGL